MVYSAMYINERGNLPWMKDCDEFSVAGNTQRVIDRIYESKRTIGRHSFESQITKNLVDLVKKLEEIQFEETPNYDDISKDFDNIDKDKDAEQR